MQSWPFVPPTPQLAYEARKAPGGSYHHNIFHQSEHLLCMLKQAYTRREAPEIILWPYTVTPWALALVELLLPRTRIVSTCCGKEKVAARWWTGSRRVCPCWQRVCPERSDAGFWPPPTGVAAHAALRAAARDACQLRGAPVRHRRRVRLLLRPKETGRQLEDEAEVLATLRALGATDVAVADGNTSGICPQIAWFAGASVVVSVHGSQLTNAIFADANARVIDLQPYAYKPESSAPSDYYAALLERTDVRYTPLASARPAAPPALKGAHPHANRTTASFGEDERACRDDSLCRLSYRDGGNILVGEAGRRRLRTLIGEHSTIVDVRLTQ